MTISIVLFKNNPLHIKQLITSLLNCTLPIEIFFLDNSPSSDLKEFIPESDSIHYRKSSTNLGYGKAHNTAIRETLDRGEYHLAMNADIYFEPGTLETIISEMDQKTDIGLLLPKVLNPDGSKQPLYKLLPKPMDLFIRRFIPSGLKGIFQKNLDTYQMSFADPDQSFDAPYLSGCFMFMRKKALKEVGSFDPNYFMYCEDVDLSRRIRENWRTRYFAEASIYHYFYKGSYKEPRLLLHHLISAVKYFNKYGWFVDKQRDLINKQTLAAFNANKKTLTLSPLE